MINDLDESIKQLLIKKGTLNSTEASIRFGAPEQEWVEPESKLTVNLYLHGIRNSHESPDYQLSREYHEHGRSA